MSVSTHHSHLYLMEHCSVIIGRNLIEANATSSVISTTWKCISPYLKILQPLWLIYQQQVIHLQGLKDFLQWLKDFQVGADGFPGSWISPVFALAIIGFLPIIRLQCDEVLFSWYMPILDTDKPGFIDYLIKSKKISGMVIPTLKNDLKHFRLFYLNIHWITFKI